jgi:uncharacterized protein
MRGEASSDVFKTWLYAAGSVLLGAWVSPLFYNAGKALAEVSQSKETNGPLKWLAGLCRKADFPDFFLAALITASVLLFLPFIEWLRAGRAVEGGSPWSLRLPKGARASTGGQRLLKNPGGLRQVCIGFAWVSGLFFVFAAVLLESGFFTWKAAPVPWARLILRTLTISFALAVLQEILFRGIAMGIFLRAMRPAAALGMSAVFFALTHFLNPPPGLNVPDPEASGVGFELLRRIAAQFSEPRAVLGTFVPLVALGVVLAYARWRTASLWLPIGLHAGWIFANAMLGGVAVATSRPDSLMWILSGSSLQQGLVPLATIILAGMLSNHLISPPDASHPSA